VSCTATATSSSPSTRYAEWVESYDPPPELIVVADAVHFFHGKLLELRAAVLEFLRQDAGDS
jgi:alpha/beta superfamily hydrolase